jgi:hypothetical protein
MLQSGRGLSSKKEAEESASQQSSESAKQKRSLERKAAEMLSFPEIITIH